MRVYYLTNAQFALSNIALRRIKISIFSDLNDPFELLAVDLSDKTHRKAFRMTKDQLNENKGLICFSKSWSNPLLWGHYAEKHTGICLGFDIPDKFLKPVIYSKSPMKIKINPKTGELIFNENNMMSRLLRTKFADWRYEDEMRLFVELDHDSIESGNYFYPFSEDFILREIVLGPRCEIPINGLRSLIENFNQPIRVIKSRIASSSFRVVEHKIAIREN